MSLDQFTPYLPAAAVVAGLLLLLWGQRDRLLAAVAWLWPAPKPETSMSPADRFKTFYALRTWCQGAGHAEAVEALDAAVLPAIIRDTNEGGPPQ